MTRTIPHNPYEDDANRYAIEATLIASHSAAARQIFATLAVANAAMAQAHEAHTANLIAAATLRDRLEYQQRPRARAVTDLMDIETRLGQDPEA